VTGLASANTGRPLSGDPTFDAAAEFVRRVEGQPGGWAQLGAVLGHPVQAGRVLAVIARLPRVRLRLSAGPAGQVLAAYYGTGWRRLPVRRIAQSVLPLPATMAEYLASGHRRTVRKKLARAARLGITVHEVAEPTEARRGPAEEVYRARGAGPAERAFDDARVSASDRWFVATYQGAAAAFVVATIDQRVVRLVTMLATPDPEVASPARFALHNEVVRVALEAGAEAVLTGSALRTWSGNRLFAHQLGYRPANLRVAVDAAGPAGRPSRPWGQPEAQAVPTSVRG
jgi:hypothetical protein